MTGAQRQDKKKLLSRRRVNLTMRFSHFKLPPIQDALIIGKRAPIGANGIARAFEAMIPGEFRLIRVEHSVVEAILVRQSDLRKVPEEILVPRLLEAAADIMDENDALHVSMSIEVIAEMQDIEVE